MISFSGRHYPVSIILQCIRWYVSYAMSYRNIKEMMEERGFEIDHATDLPRIVVPVPELVTGRDCVPPSRRADA